MAAPNQLHLHARIRQQGSRAARPAATRSELVRSAERIHSLASFIDNPSTRRSDILNLNLDDLPRNYESISWKCVYNAGEAYRTTGLIEEPWSPRCLDEGKSWCFTVLPLLSSKRLVRVTVDKTSSWFSGRKERNPNGLLVNRLRTKMPIQGRFFRMIEITLADQTPAIVSLCRIKEARPRLHYSYVISLPSGQQQDDDIVITQATSMDIGQPQEGIQPGLYTEANLNSGINGGQFSFPPAIQPGLNTEANMNLMVNATNINGGFTELHHFQANMDPVNSVPNTSEARTITIDGGEYIGHENAILGEDLACHLGLDFGDSTDLMSVLATNPHEGISNGTMGHDPTSNFLEDVSIVSANKGLFSVIHFIDENEAEVLAAHLKCAASILKNYGASAMNPSQVAAADHYVSQFLTDDEPA